MTLLLAVLSLLLIVIIVVQIGKVTELAAKIRGEEEVQDTVNKRQASYSLIFMILFLVACIVSAVYYKNYMLGYGPHSAASVHGNALDRMFDVTLFFTGIVFVITQILLFYFAFKYRAEKGRKALYMPHDNRLEIVWTVVPAVVMAFLVISGLDAWNEVMADIPEGATPALVPEDENEYLEVEATGYQFAWHLRYPGEDGKLGARDYKLIKPGVNEVGQDWTDKKNLDDFHPGEIVLPVGKTVRIRITARDVLHNFYLPQFRVKMDAVPGMPTYFVFTPEKTTEEYRQELSNYEEYQQPVDPADPESPMLWEAFEYELACAELCGSGHYSMRRVVRVVSMDEYKTWLNQQQSFYFSQVRGTADDPWKDILHDVEIEARRAEFNTKVDEALAAEGTDAKTVQFDYVNFQTGSAELTPLSRYELDNLVDALNKYATMTIELAGHTDSTGDADSNLALSQNRAQTVYDYLISKGIAAGRLSARGYGQTRPIADNATDAGREQNRRTEFRILTQ